MLAQRQFPFYRSHQEQHVRRSFAAARANEDAGIAVVIEGDVLGGGGNQQVPVGIGSKLADVVQFFPVGRDVQIVDGSAVIGPKRRW